MTLTVERIALSRAVGYELDKDEALSFLLDRIADLREALAFNERELDNLMDREVSLEKELDIQRANVLQEFAEDVTPLFPTAWHGLDICVR